MRDVRDEGVITDAEFPSSAAKYFAASHIARHISGLRAGGYVTKALTYEAELIRCLADTTSLDDLERLIVAEHKKTR